MEFAFNNKIENQFLSNSNIISTITRDDLIILKDIKKKIKHRMSVEDTVNRFDFDLIKTDRDCGGYFSLDSKEIAINSYKDVETFDCKNTIAHELSHLIQSKTKDFSLGESILLSDRFRLEQQCEAIASYLSPILFKQKYIPCYNCVDAALFLKDWYGDYVQDDLLLKLNK